MLPEDAAPRECRHQKQSGSAAKPGCKLRFLSNAKLINCYPDKIELDVLPAAPSGGWARMAYGVRILKELVNYDAFIVFNPDFHEAVIAFAAKRLLRRRTSVIFFDALLQRPVGLTGAWKSRVKQLLFTGVDRFFCVHKDTSGYQKYFGINAAKFVYIPFKANNFHDRLNYPVGDEGYVLACGASFRDYRTFVEAVGRLNVPAKILLPRRSDAIFHHTEFDEGQVPPNVQVIRHDFDKSSWNQAIAKSRVVVIPIQKDAIQAAGISAYLEAMAIGKAVVITEGVSTRGMLTEKEAAIVPAVDPAAMKRAIEKLWNDPDYRERLAKGGQEYALSLGGVERLARDILEGVCACIDRRPHA